MTPTTLTKKKGFCAICLATGARRCLFVAVVMALFHHAGTREAVTYTGIRRVQRGRDLFCKRLSRKPDLIPLIIKFMN